MLLLLIWEINKVANRIVVCSEFLWKNMLYRPTSDEYKAR